MRWLKRAIVASSTHPLMRSLTAPLTRGAVPILMLHRFADPDGAAWGHQPEALDQRLGELLRHGYTPLPLVGALERLRAGETIERSVVFTVDDGYADFARFGAPVFARHHCPVTVFLSSGFLDGAIWYWWDQLEYVLEHGPGPEQLKAIVARLKQVPDKERVAAIHELAAARGVEIPALAPPRYAPMSWAQVRACEEQGVTFGAHSATHPVLSRVDDRTAEAEIVTSWRRLREETRAPVNVFCYPHGEPGDFGPREQEILRREQFLAALSTEPGFAGAEHFRVPESGTRFAVPRYPYFDAPGSFWQIVGGVERAKHAARHWFKR